MDECFQVARDLLVIPIVEEGPADQKWSVGRLDCSRARKAGFRLARPLLD